jgi:hypothetical protein
MFDNRQRYYESGGCPTVSCPCRFSSRGSPDAWTLCTSRPSRGAAARRRGAPACRVSRLTNEGLSGSSAARFATQCPVRFPCASNRRLSAAARRPACVRRASFRRRFGTAGRGQLHACAACLGQPDRNCLFRRSGSVFAFSNVMDLFPDELACLGAGRLAALFVVSCTAYGLFFRHSRTSSFPEEFEQHTCQCPALH